MAQIKRQNKPEEAQLGVTMRGALRLGGVFAAAFLIGRVSISGGIWPFGAAFVLMSFLNAQTINPCSLISDSQSAPCGAGPP